MKGIGLERLIFFTDAIAAIAITVLILPLVDSVPEAARAGTSGFEFLRENWLELLTFLISFVVIARLWLAHHALFTHVAGYSTLLVWMSMIWSLTIVVLPLPSAMTAAFDTDPAVVAFYIGTMTLSSVCLVLMAFLVRGNPALESEEHPVNAQTVRGLTATTAGFTLALVIGTVFPRVNFWALFLLLVVSWIEPRLPGGSSSRAARARRRAQA